MHHLPEMALVMPFLNRLTLQALALPQACSAAPALQAQYKTKPKKKNIIPSSLQQTLHVVLNTTTSLIPCIHAQSIPQPISPWTWIYAKDVFICHFWCTHSYIHLMILTSFLYYKM
jgi:hypothetical protein